MDQRRYFDRIYAIAAAIPRGFVMTYGQVGEEAGCGPRTVGWAMAGAVDESQELPWHRVVGADGYLRIGRRSPDLAALQRRLLEEDGVAFRENGDVDMALHQVGRANEVRCVADDI